MRVLIVGCGYVGLPLGARLAKLGHEVFGLNRTSGGESQFRAAEITPLLGDITRPKDLASLPGPFDWVVNTVSSSRGGLEIYRQVYLEGTRNLLDWLRHSPATRYVYTSSTSVYGQVDGSWVDESSPTHPQSPTSQILMETEQMLAQAVRQDALPAVILRVAGIYGPGRGHLFLQYLRDAARIRGDGTRFLNMIHLDDVVGSALAALVHGQPGEIYNASDDEPVSQREFFEWLSRQLRKPMPPVASEEERTEPKRGLTHKRVSNRKLKELLGYGLTYPTFREGYIAEIKRLGNLAQ